MADIPVLVLSGENCEHTRAEMIKAGCVEYVTKPFDIDHLERVVMASVDEGAAQPPLPA
ncbi:hypothetical protein ACFL12_09090 [Pseudomonadota bacterium]